MIDPDDIDKGKRTLDALNPPGKSVPFHHVPSIERISPALARRAEIIGRDAGDNGGSKIFIERKKIRMCPNIGTLERREDRNIADDLNSFFVGVFLECRPLAGETPLSKFPEFDFVVQFDARFFKCRRFALSNVAIPFAPFLTVMFALQRHEKGVIGKPAFVLMIERFKLRLIIRRCVRKKFLRRMM